MDEDIMDPRDNLTNINDWCGEEYNMFRFLNANNNNLN